MNIKNIIWDLDGTLMDTLCDLHLATNYALKEYGMPERTLDEVRQFVGNGVRNLMLRAVPEGADNPHFEDCFAAFKTYYKSHCKDNTSLYAGIGDVLTFLKSQGYRMAIVSNKLQAGVDELYDEWFRNTIDVAIGEREDIQRKPAPDMVHLAMQELSAMYGEPVTANNSIYIGDSDVDIATARNSGLPCISVLWGFRDKEFLKAHGANVFAKTPSDVSEILRTLFLKHD